MGRLSALFLLLALSLGKVWAQGSSQVSPDDLYRQAHDRLTNVLPAENRAFALATLLQKAVSRQLPEVPSWAEETFNVALQSPAGVNRVFAQETVISVLSRSDPDRALTLLDRLDPRPPDTMNSFTAGRGQSVATVFSFALAKHGKSIVPTLLQTADRIGSGGLYPYMGLAPLMNGNAENDEKLLRIAVAKYQQSQPTVTNDFEFVVFLRRTRVPPSVATSMASQIAVRLQQFAAANAPCHSTLRLYTDKGMTVLNCGERMIYEALPTLERLNPRAAAALKAGRPNFQQLEGATIQSRMPMANESVTGEVSSAAAQKSQAQFDVGMMVGNISKQDPARAEQLAENMPDAAVRLNLKAQLAVQAAATDPAKGRQFINEVLNEIGQVDDVRWKMTVLSNVARATARLPDTALFEQIARTLFPLGHEFAVSMREGPTLRRMIWASNCYRLCPITRHGALQAPQLMLTLIPTLEDSEGEAYLLMNLADAILHPASVM